MKNRNTALLFLCLLWSVAFVGCASTSKSAPSAGSNPLLGTWGFYAFNTKYDVSPPSKLYTARFGRDMVHLIIDDKEAYASYLLKGKSGIEITSRITVITKNEDDDKEEEDKRREIEWDEEDSANDFISFLYDAYRYSFDKDENLVLTSRWGSLIFSSIPENNQLLGTWMFLSFDTEHDVPPPSDLYLAKFEEDAVYFIIEGTAAYASYRIKGRDNIEITSRITAIPEDEDEEEREEVEWKETPSARQFMTSFYESNHYSFDKDRNLVLTSRWGSLIFSKVSDP